MSHTPQQPPPYQSPYPNPTPYPYATPQPGTAPPSPYPPGHPGGLGPGPRPPGDSKRVVIAIVAAVALVAIVVGGVLLSGGEDGGDGDGGSGGDAELTRHPTLDASGIPFPDPQQLSYGEGPEAACGAVSEIMLARGYEFESAGEDRGGVDCWYAAPASATLEDGTRYFRTNVYMEVGAGAQTTYDAFLGAMSSNHGGGTAETTWSPLYEFPVGEEGWIVHSQDAARGDGTASFRRGDTTFYVTTLGWTERGEQDEALTEELTFREITDVVTALGGGQAGEPQISESAAKEYPGGLPDFGDPLPPTEGSGPERCAALTAVATEQLYVQVNGEFTDDDSIIPSFGCTYEPAESAYELDNVPIHSSIRIQVEDYSPSEVDYAQGALGRRLRSVMDDYYSEESGGGPLYSLPAGTSGFVITKESTSDTSSLEAAYVVGDYYVNITIGGFFSGEGFDTRALTEEELISDLTALLNAMNG